jgi:hypothetical protein
MSSSDKKTYASRNCAQAAFLWLCAVAHLWRGSSKQCTEAGSKEWKGAMITGQSFFRPTGKHRITFEPTSTLAYSMRP